MEVDDALIDRLAALARLRFTSGERDEIRDDLRQMIGFVEKLRELDTAGVPPLLHMGSGVDQLRDDREQGAIPREEALRNAPGADGIFFRVPKVIRK